MEIYAREEGGAEELLLCPACGSVDLEPVKEETATGAVSWSLMSRLSVECRRCGGAGHFSWPGRVHLRCLRIRQEA